MEKLDYLVVGSGLYGATLSYLAHKSRKRVLVLEKRPHIGGNIYTEDVQGIQVHRYGAHIFHTNNDKVWQFVQQFSEFNDFINQPKANYKGELYSLPFNMNTFQEMWGVTDPETARSIIDAQKNEAGILEPSNLEEQAISQVGKEIYERLVKGYTEKQWGRPCSQLPAFIIKRLPVRFEYNNNYYNAKYQGIPKEGYTKMIERMLDGVEVHLNTDYLAEKDCYNQLAEKVVYTGPIDAYFGCVLGALEYRTLRFETEELDTPSFQGNAAINYTDLDTPWTRIIEHKWFTFGRDENGKEIPNTIITKEYSSQWEPGSEPYYPVNDEKNNRLLQQYKELAEKEDNVLFGGRLGEYRYYDMDTVIEAAMNLAEREQITT